MFSIVLVSVFMLERDYTLLIPDVFLRHNAQCQNNCNNKVMMRPLRCTNQKVQKQL